MKEESIVDLFAKRIVRSQAGSSRAYQALEDLISTADDKVLEKLEVFMMNCSHLWVWPTSLRGSHGGSTNIQRGVGTTVFSFHDSDEKTGFVKMIPPLAATTAGSQEVYVEGWDFAEKLEKLGFSFKHSVLELRKLADDPNTEAEVIISEVTKYPDLGFLTKEKAKEQEWIDRMSEREW